MSTFAADLKAWAKRLGLKRDEAAAELRVARSTYDGWCAGRQSALEGALRRLMELIETSRAAK